MPKLDFQKSPSSDFTDLYKVYGQVIGQYTASRELKWLSLTASREKSWNFLCFDFKKSLIYHKFCLSYDQLVTELRVVQFGL